MPARGPRDSLDMFRRRLKQHYFAYKHARRDFDHTLTQRGSFTSFDFSIIASILISRSDSRDSGLVGYDNTCRRLMGLLDHYGGVFNSEVIIAWPCYIELIDFIDHQTQEYELIANSQEHSEQLHLQLVKSEEIVLALSKLINRKHLVGADKIINLIDRDLIKGTANFLNERELVFSNIDKGLITQVRDEIGKSREYKQYDPSDREMHQHLDALMTVESIMINHLVGATGGEFLYVGPNKVRHSFGDLMDDLSRHPLAITARLHGLSQVSSSRDMIVDCKEFLESGERHLRAALDEIESGRYSNIDDVSNLMLGEWSYKNQEYMMPLYDEKDDERIMRFRDRREELIDTFVNPRAIRDRYKEASEELAARARLLASLVPESLDEEILADVGLSANGRILELVKRYTVS